MKHAAIAAALLAAVFLLCLFSADAVRRGLDETRQTLALAGSQAAAGNFEAAAAGVRAAGRDWDARAGLYGAVLSQQDEDGVLRGLSALEALAKARGKTEFLSACAELEAELLRLREIQTPRLRNLL